MAIGGYIASQFQWVGGRTDSLLDRLNYVLTGIIDALINSNTGWSVDTDFIQTSSAYISVPPNTSSNFSIAKFLINQNGMRLVICYSTTSLTLNPLYTCYNSDDTQNAVNNGISLAVIPPDSGETWSITDPTYVIGLPSSAVGWCSLTFANTWSQTTFVKANQTGVTYSYYWISKGNQLALFEKCSEWTTTFIRGCVIGEIIGGLAQTADNIPVSHYGMFSLNSDNEGESQSPSNGINNNYQFGIGGSEYLNRVCAQVFRADGTSLRGYKNSNNNVFIYALDIKSLSTKIANANIATGGRWTPFAVALNSSDPTTGGVVAGDGFKGYLNTDFIRYVPCESYTRGQTLGNNSEFYFIGGGVAIGWDYSNTSVSLF